MKRSPVTVELSILDKIHIYTVPIETQQEDNDKIHIYTVYPLRHSKKTMTKFTSTLCSH